MRYILGIFVFCLYSCGNTYYIVRHGEKAPVPPGSTQQAASDPPLSDSGEARAIALRERLKNKSVEHIFSTNYKRTVSTVLPLNERLKNVTIELYSPRKDSLDPFITKLKSIRKGNVVIAGHSNTVDDIVNRLTGESNIPSDLDESQYDNLFIVKRKGKRFVYRQEKYGEPSN